jgi:hypothetical protein
MNSQRFTIDGFEDLADVHRYIEEELYPLMIHEHKPMSLKGILEDYLWFRGRNKSYTCTNIIVHYYTDMVDCLQLEVEYRYPDKIIFMREFITGGILGEN